MSEASADTGTSAATTPAPAPADAAKDQAATEYVILSKTGQSWVEQATVTARSAKAAVREWLDQGADKPEGVYVAVPARSWQPITVKTETQTKIKLT